MTYSLQAPAYYGAPSPTVGSVLPGDVAFFPEPFAAAQVATPDAGPASPSGAWVFAAALLAGVAAGAYGGRSGVAEPAAGDGRVAALAALGRRIDRRSLAAGAALLAAAAPAFADGRWASHFGEFTDADFEGMKTTDSGLQYKIVEEGTGVKPGVGQKIKANYAGYLLNGAKFDASYDRGKPLEFKVGVGNVIKGWDEALVDMKVGEKRLLRIPPELGYGAKGAGGVIPGNATLVFYVELVTLAA